MYDSAGATVAEDGTHVPDLPVFCISAREAQKLENRNKSDGRAMVFKQ